MPPTKKLLVADDSLIIQKVIRLALANEGYDIQAISDGNDAVQQISVLRPSVVLIDVTLPGRDAFEVKRAVNALPDLKDVKFILMSSAYEKVDEAQIKEVNFDGRLTKPFDPPHLRQLLDSVLKHLPPLPSAGSSLKGRMPPAPPSSQPPLTLEPPTLPPLPGADSSGLSLPPLPSLQPPTLPPSQGLPPGLPTWNPEAPSHEPPAGWEPPSAESILDPIRPMEPPALPSAPPSLPSGASDEDIKHLTESTIRMSGLDDFQWSIQEPSIRPMPSMSDIGGSTFPPSELPRFEEPTKKTFVPPAAPSGSSASEILHSPEFERMVQQQVRAQLEQMARQLLPQIAESVIRQEINRLLSEQP